MRLESILDPGLDEMAATSHPGAPVRAFITMAMAGIASTVLDARLCAAWAAYAVGCEVWSWFITRKQARGEAASLPERANHIASFIAAAIGWMGLGWLLWTSGTVSGALMGVAIWYSVVFFSQTFAYRSRTAVVVGGLFPAVFVAMAVSLSPGPEGLERLPVALTLGLGLLFAAEGVKTMLQARSKHDEIVAQLSERESQYRVLADNITDVIAMATPEGRRVYISPSVEQAMGYSVAELMTTENATYVHPEDLPALRDRMAEIARTGGQATTEYRVLHRDGRVIDIETSFTLAPGENGGSDHLISVSRNVAARKAMERELIEARERAEHAAAAKSDFLANMTHELRTPLNAIVGFSGLLEQSKDLTSQDARHAGLIRDASVTLLELVNSVLDFSRLEAGAVEVDPRPFDIAATARACAALLEDQARAKGLDLRVVVSGEGGLVMGDDSRIRQVLLNFLSNAVKFTARGAVELRLDLGPQTDGRRRVAVEVADSGIGIPADQIDQVFERFTQADVSVSRRFGGTGLGLSICRRLIELMGGRIGARSVEGEGSTFWFEIDLPVADASAEGASEIEVQELERSIRLLLVEDVAVNRELIVALLAPFDVDIDMACDGVQAIEAMEQGGYDLVLMDVQMPVMDGLTAAARIRAMPAEQCQTTPIIAMTANVLPDQIARCIEAGMDDHLGKPISPARLVEVLSHWSIARRGESEAVAARR